MYKALCFSNTTICLLYRRLSFNTNNKYFECKICSFHKKNVPCTAIKAGSVAQLDRATPF